jgi:hypothetical protein
MPLTTPSHYIHNRQPVSGGTVKYWAKSRFRFTPVDGSPYPDTATADYTATTVADGSWPQGTLVAGDYYVSLEASGLVRSWTGDLIAPSAVASTTCMPDGTEALPGWPFCADIDTGIWRDGANQLAVSSNGKLSWEISQAFGEFVYFDRAQAYEHYLQTHSVVQADAVGTSRHGVEWKTDGDFFRLSPTEDIILGTKATLTSQVTGFTYFQTIEGTPTGLPRFRDVIGSHVPAMIRTDTYEWWGYFGELIGWRRIGPPGGSGAGGALTLDDLDDVATAGQADGDTIVRASGIYVPTNFKLTKLKDVDATAPTNGQVPTWDTGVTPNRFTFQTPSGGGGGAPTTAEYVATASDGTLSAEVVIPGLAGSADIAGAAGGGISEEYDTSTTGLTWTPGAPTTVDSDTTHKSRLYIRATDATERLGLRSWAPGSGAFDARCHLVVGTSTIAGGNFPGGGFIITDAGNNNRLLLNRTYDTTNKRFEAIGYTYAGGSYTARTTNVIYSQARYWRITRDGSNNITWWYSDDGLQWVIMDTFAFTLTVANIGYRVVHAGTSTDTKFYSDWLRTDV